MGPVGENMKVHTSLVRVFSFLLLALTAVGCSQTKTSETVFPKVSSQCEDSSIQGRYVVRWASGRVTLHKGGDRSEVLKNFVEKNLDRLELVEPDYRLVLPKSAGDLPRTAVNSVDNWGAVRINADVAWAQGSRGGGITVAVIDSGMDIEHSQLRNQLAVNSNEVAGNGLDDDHNGFVDDVSGFDFTTDSPAVHDSNSHGTHVSGIIAAEHQDNKAGVRSYVQGIAPEAKILPLTFIDSSGSGSLYDAMRAIDYATARGVRVINASWGGAGCSTIMRDQIGALYSKKIVFVAAAGNSGLNIDYSPEYPAAFNLLSQITVGATGDFDSRAQFSNYGDEAVHIFAPGVDIVSTLPNQMMGAMSGTSMATPMVVGAVAVLLGAKPQATMEELRRALYVSAHFDSTYRNVSRGRIDLGAALSKLLE